MKSKKGPATAPREISKPRPLLVTESDQPPPAQVRELLRQSSHGMFVAWLQFPGGGNGSTSSFSISVAISWLVVFNLGDVTCRLQDTSAFLVVFNTRLFIRCWSVWRGLWLIRVAPHPNDPLVPMDAARWCLRCSCSGS